MNDGINFNRSSIEISQYNGLQNTFLIMQEIKDCNYAKLAFTLCHDDFWESDGLIVIDTKQLIAHFYNKDGSEATMCGNGIRCLAHYLYLQSYVKRKGFVIKTLAGAMKIKILDVSSFMCRVKIGKASYDLKLLGLDNTQNSFTIKNGQKEFKTYNLFLGTIHTVIFTDNPQADIIKYGKDICHNKTYTKGTNVNFIKIINKRSFIIRTYEKGVGITSACGSGASASFVIAKRLGYLKKEALAYTAGGKLKLRGKRSIYLTGPSEFMKKGRINY